MEVPSFGGCDEVIGTLGDWENISRWHKTLAQYVSTCPIIDLCLYTERRLGQSTMMRWWDQESLVLPGRPTEGGEADKEAGTEMWSGVGTRGKPNRRGIMQQRINHMNGAYSTLTLSLCYGYGKPPHNIYHDRGLWSLSKRDMIH